MKTNSFFYLLVIIVCSMGCSQEVIDEETNYQQGVEKLKVIASRYGFSSMPIELNEDFTFPLTEEYCNYFKGKLIILRKILDNSKEVKPIVQSRALSDRTYHGTISIDGCKFPISIYWDETFNPIHCYAVAGGTIDCTRYPIPNYNYVDKISLYHFSTKMSASSIPNLYFVMRCNFVGSGNGFVGFKKHVEFIIKFNVETLDLETTITVFEDGIWFPLD